MEKLDEPFYVIREQVSVLLRAENSFVCFFFHFCDEKKFARSDPSPLLRPYGLRCFLEEQTYRHYLAVGFLWYYRSVPPNLAASLDTRKGSSVMTCFEKERRYSYLYQPLSEV